MSSRRSFLSTTPARRDLAFSAALLVAAVLPACSSSSDEPAEDGPWQYGATIPAEESETGDAVHGRELLLGGDYMSCGIPQKLWDTGSGPIAGALGGDANAPRIADRPGKNAEMPYNMNAFKTP